MSTGHSPPKIACPHCQALIKVPGLAAGSLVNCPKCGKGFRLGESEESDRSQRSEVRDQQAGQAVAGQSSQIQSPNSQVHNPRPTVPSPTPKPPGAKPPPSPKSGSVVPQEFAPAAKATQPAHRPPVSTSEAPQPPAPTAAERAAAPPAPRRASKPDHLVDPNLLPPPPPIQKPKAQEVAVVCTVCGTRMYAPLDKIGQSIKCPDCHTVIQVIAPETTKQAKPSGPTLEGAEEFNLSDPGQRPAYRPLVAPRGEYEILAALDPAQVTHGWDMSNAATATGEEDEFRLSAPVERPMLEPPRVKLPEPDPEEKLYDGRYDDGLIGDNVDPRQPDAWKKAPFVYGIVEFLFQPGALSRVVMYSVGLALLLNLMRLTVDSGLSSDPTLQVAAIFFSMASMASMGLWLGPFSACCFGIVQDTANGAKEVESWPPWSPTEWFYCALFFPIAGLISGIPGMFLTLSLFTVGLDPRIAAVVLSAPLPLSWLVLFPLVLYSMLAEGSVMTPLSKHTLRSFQVAGDAWILFYMYSIVIFLLLAFAGSLALGSSIILRSLGACLFVPVAFLYARLLGRLMWYAAQQEAKS